MFPRYGELKNCPTCNDLCTSLLAFSYNLVHLTYWPYGDLSSDMTQWPHMTHDLIYGQFSVFFTIWPRDLGVTLWPTFHLSPWGLSRIPKYQPCSSNGFRDIEVRKLEERKKKKKRGKIIRVDFGYFQHFWKFDLLTSNWPHGLLFVCPHGV